MRRLWALFGSHTLGLWFMGLLALACLLGGTLPQVPRMSNAQQQNWSTDWSGLSVWLENLQLSDLFAAPWFLALAGLLLLSLLVGTAQCVRKRYRLWQGAGPVSREVTGSGPLPPELDGSAATGCHRHGSLFLLGVPLLHLGIAVLVAGGLWSAKSGFGAHLELTEGEVYEGAGNKLMRARGRALPDSFAARLRLDRTEVAIEAGRYLRTLQAQFSYQQDKHAAVERALVRANAPLQLGEFRLYPDNSFGYSALFDRYGADGKTHLMLVNFPIERAAWGKAWEAKREMSLNLGGTPLYYRMRLNNSQPPRLELTVQRGGEVRYSGQLYPGSKVELDGYHLVFRGTAPWMGFYLASDPAASLILGGGLLSLLGFALHLGGRFRRYVWVCEGESWRVRVWESSGRARTGGQPKTLAEGVPQYGL